MHDAAIQMQLLGGGMYKPARIEVVVHQHHGYVIDMHGHKLCKRYNACRHFSLPEIGYTSGLGFLLARLIIETVADVILPIAVYILIDTYVSYINGHQLCDLRGKETAA